MRNIFKLLKFLEIEFLKIKWVDIFSSFLFFWVILLSFNFGLYLIFEIKVLLKIFEKVFFLLGIIEFVI